MTVNVTDPSLTGTSRDDAQTTPAAQSSRGGEPRDAELLRRYVRHRDDAAFAELVRRYSRLVIGVCRRVLRSEHDIEDAFQATFLVLARDAARIRKSASLASWLHGVAYRSSLRACDASHRRRRLLRDVTMTSEPADNSSAEGPFAEVENRHQRQALDEELAALPENYRAPLVLHYLEEKTNAQVAEELGLTVSAVEGRLKRGKKELRLRLARRGVGLSVAVAAMHTIGTSAEAAPLETLIARTIDAGLSYAGGEPAGPIYTPEAARLAGQELAAMSTTSAVTLATVLLLPLVVVLPGHGADVSAIGTAPPIVESTTVNATTAGAFSTFLAQNAEGDESADSFTGGFGGESGFESGEFDADGGDKTEAEAGGTGVDGLELKLSVDSAGVLGLAPKSSANSTNILRYDEQTPNARRIEEELSKQTEVEFIDTPLDDALVYLADLHNITILIDGVALTDVGIPLDEPVNLIMTGVQLRSVLNLLLKDLALTTVIRDEVLYVTTQEKAEEYMVTRVYNIRPLYQIPSDDLIKVLQESLPSEPDWVDTTGIGGSLMAVDGALVVRQTQSVHEEVVDLLAQLQRHREYDQGPKEQRNQAMIGRSTSSGANNASPARIGIGGGAGMSAAGAFARSSGGDAEGSDSIKATSKGEAQPFIYFKFQAAPWNDVLRVFADANDWEIEMAGMPSGTLTYVDDHGYKPQEALALLNALLNARGYELVPHEGGLRCQKR